MSVLVVVILVLVLFVSTMAFFFTRLARKTEREAEAAALKRAEIEARWKRATPANGTVVNRHARGAYHGATRTVVEIRIVPLGDEGGASRRGIWEVDIASVAHLEPGSVVPVRLDVVDPTRVFPDVSWARTHLDGI